MPLLWLLGGGTLLGTGYFLGFSTNKAITVIVVGGVVYYLIIKGK